MYFKCFAKFLHFPMVLWVSLFDVCVILLALFHDFGSYTHLSSIISPCTIINSVVFRDIQTLSRSSLVQFHIPSILLNNKSYVYSIHVLVPLIFSVCLFCTTTDGCEPPKNPAIPRYLFAHQSLPYITYGNAINGKSSKNSIL